MVSKLSVIGYGIWDQNLKPVCQIWTNSYPEEEPQTYTIPEKIFCTPPLVARSVSLSNFVAFFTPDGRMAHIYIETYVLMWVFSLSWLLFYSTPAKWFAICIAVYRIIDILSYQLCIFFVDSKTSNFYLKSVTRSLILAMLNLYELVVAYALLFFYAGTLVFNVEKQPVIENTIQAFYYSMVTMATVGYGEIVPKGDVSRMLVVAELITGITFILIILPMLVANMAVTLNGVVSKKSCKH